MAGVSLHGVSKRYGETVALAALDLEIREGEFVSLLGPSGCGKTTTLRLVAGFIDPTTGSIRLDGEDVTRLPPQRRSIGMVFQDYALFPHLTVAENVAFGLRERRYPRERIGPRVLELLEMVQLGERARHYPAQLSGGQQQRVALARAVAHPPRVLLMDEPLGALDLKLRVAMQSELRRIQRELGITTLYVTHDQSEAMSMSDRIAVMREGRLDQLGTAEELYDRPRTRFVADFVGRINLIDGEVDGGGGVRAAGALLRAAVDGLVARTPITVALRPEHLRLAPPDTAPGPAENALSGEIREVRFAGNVLDVEVRVDDGATVLVETRPGDPHAETGRRVRVLWPVTRTNLLTSV